MEGEAATRLDILHFFGQGNFIFVVEKSGNFEKGCQWQPQINAISCKFKSNLV